MARAREFMALHPGTSLYAGMFAQVQKMKGMESTK